jgi:hypothetical protein
MIKFWKTCRENCDHAPADAWLEVGVSPTGTLIQMMVPARGSVLAIAVFSVMASE